MATKTIKVDYLARVEGEGALTIRFRGQEVKEVALRIFEPPRFFEAFLRGRAHTEPPDITSRICGICPIAYQMSSCQAIEDALGLATTPEIERLRRLVYCGEWIESHVLHAFFLSAPDFLRQPDILAVARTEPELVKNALRMKKAGNAIVRMIGGREIHPVNVRIGGFFRAPTRSELEQLVPELRWSRDAALEALPRLARFPFPSLDRDYEFVSLRHDTDYPIERGRVVSSRGLDIPVSEWDRHFVEEQVPHSTALHARLRERGRYLVGPLARFNLNFDRLSPLAREAAERIGLTPPVRNPFRMILVRMVEAIYAFDEALRIIESYSPPKPAVDAPPRAGTGFGATEAPRGLLYHRYSLDHDGTILDANIVPPTAQNQATIEDDLRELAPQLVAATHAEATWLAEQAIRNYDPCISCSTHFLTLKREEV